MRRPDRNARTGAAARPAGRRPGEPGRRRVRRAARGRRRGRAGRRRHHDPRRRPTDDPTDDPSDTTSPTTDPSPERLPTEPARLPSTSRPPRRPTPPVRWRSRAPCCAGASTQTRPTPGRTTPPPSSFLAAGVTNPGRGGVAQRESQWRGGPGQRDHREAHVRRRLASPPPGPDSAPRRPGRRSASTVPTASTPSSCARAPGR